MMNPYRKYIEPMLVSCACGLKPIAKQRSKIVPRAGGTVLEVGFGSGHNLPFYDAAKVGRLIALEPSEEMRARARDRLAATPLAVEIIGLKGEEIPLDDNSVDTVLVTYTLCTIPDVMAALGQMRRVMKKSGTLLFCEHGLAPDAGVAKWQNRLDSPWSALAGGCHMNRDIAGLVREGGFEIADMETMYLPKTPKILGYNSWGSAQPA